MSYSSEYALLYRTRSAYIWTRLLSVPFWGMIYVLPIILYKDMHASSLGITIIITLKPMSALFAPYWSQAIYKRPDRVVSNLVWANILRYLPFLFVPWVQSPWYIIGAFGLYMMLHRGVIPAWMETIKCNLPELMRERLIAFGSIIDYCATALLPLLIGVVLDQYDNSWRFLFLIAASLGLISTISLYQLRTRLTTQQPLQLTENLWNRIKNKIGTPWKESWNLMKKNGDFLNFQIGFMLGGAGLMIIQPILPIFFVDTLNLSYTKMLLALSLFKGIGFALTTPIWVKFFRKWNIFYLSGIVTLLAAAFPLLLFCSKFHIFLLYLAYGLYGIMQAGSDLSWHMSGPVFASEKDSTIYSGTNVLAVGIRGCLIPLLGGILFSMTNSMVVLILGSLLCLIATRHLIAYSMAIKIVKNSLD